MIYNIYSCTSFPFLTNLIAFTCLIELANRSNIKLSNSGENGDSCLVHHIFLIFWLRKINHAANAFVYFYFTEYIYMNECWIPYKFFLASKEIITWLFSFVLFFKWIIGIHYLQLNHLFSHKINSAFSWLIIFLMCCWLGFWLLI